MSSCFVFQARKLYYQPTTGTYYEYDERTKTHKVHSRIDISQYNTHQNYNYPAQCASLPGQQRYGQQPRPPLHQSHQHQHLQPQGQQQQQPHSGAQIEKINTGKIDIFGKCSLP